MLKEHADNKAAFSKMVIMPSNILDFLRFTCVKPHLKALYKYIKSVTLRSWPKNRSDDVDAEKASNIIRAIANRTIILPAESVDGWIEQILNGNVAQPTPFTLASLPSIENLVMEYRPKDYRHIKSMSVRS